MQAIKVNGLTSHKIESADFERAIWFFKYRAQQSGSVLVERWRWHEFQDNILEYQNKKPPKILLHLHNEGYIDADYPSVIIVDIQKIEQKLREIELVRSINFDIAGQLTTAEELQVAI